MSGAHEPLHQPPNPDDLRRQPPGAPDCARARGWMRDFADGDLDALRGRQLEDHVHRCRTCAVELARAEHEVLRLRSAFAALAPVRSRLPSDFASRVVERLVLDETALVSQDALARAAAAAAAQATEPAPASAVGRRPSIVLAAVAVLGASLLLWMLALGAEWFDGGAAAPQQTARLVIEDATDAFVRDRRVGVGEGLGERQSLRVGRGGRARVAWHDPTLKSQPAALLHVHGDGQIRLDAAGPSIDGRVDIETMRPVSIPLPDGSRVDLGVGEYSILVSGRARDEALGGMPADLFVEVAVESGDEAMVWRDGFETALVATGFAGAYQTDSAVVVRPISGGGVGVAGPVREEAPAPQGAQRSLLAFVRDMTGQPVRDAQFTLHFAQAGDLRVVNAASTAQGTIELGLNGGLSARHLIVRGGPQPWQGNLGYVAPHALPVYANGPNDIAVYPVQFAASVPFLGDVRDENGSACGGVTVVPCVVDELFGTVWPLFDRRTQSDSFGQFRCERLPPWLPPHQGLMLLLHHDLFEPRAVAIPVRGSVLATQPFPAIELRPLQTATLRQLPANEAVEIIEEVAGLPRGSCIVTRPTFVDGSGQVSGLPVGRGPFWLRVVGESGNGVRPLVVDYVAGQMRLQPQPNSYRPWSAALGAMQLIGGTPVGVVATTRFDHAVATTVDTGPTWRWIDGGGRVAPVQVYSVAAEGGPERALARFLGFAGVPSMSPDLHLSETSGEQHLVALGADGSIATTSVLPGQSGLSELQATGRVLVHPALRPANGAVLSLEFTMESQALEGMTIRATRFASAVTGWEARDLVPGTYSVRIGTHRPTVHVPAGGWVVVAP